MVMAKVWKRVWRGWSAEKDEDEDEDKDDDDDDADEQLREKEGWKSWEVFEWKVMSE